MFICFKCELLKSRRKHTVLILLTGVLVQVLWIVGALVGNSIDYKSVGYQSLLYQFSIINSLCFPVLISVLVSHICDMEHKGNTYKYLFSLQDKKFYWNIKWLLTFLYLLIMLIFQVSLIYFLGKILGFTDTFIIQQYSLYFLSSTATSLFIATIILSFALLIKNQFIPFLIGITMGFLGFMSAFFPVWFMKLIPSSYYMLLSTSGMNWDVDTRIITYYYRSFPILDFCTLVITIVILFCLFKTIFIRKEV